MTYIQNALPPLLTQFIITLSFSFVVGLEFRRYQLTNHYRYHFGSTRTIMLVGILGFILYSLDPGRQLFLTGFILLNALLCIYYWHLASEKHFSLFSALLTLAIYFIGPIAADLPNWFLILFIVVLLMILSEKPLIHRISDQIASEEIITLAKFLVISGVILPLLPDEPIAELLPVTYYKVWLAVIVVSGFSYFSYLCERYFFKSPSLLVLALLGGLYSSTVATIVISRRAQQQSFSNGYTSASLILATSMMYLRLLIIIYVFDQGAGKILFVPFMSIMLVSLALVFLLINFPNQSRISEDLEHTQHPLELSTATVFAGLFVLFTFLTHWVIEHHGKSGLHFLALMAGCTDIDPFVLSLVSGQYRISDSAVVSALVLASGSNNLLKAVYALFIARNASVQFAVFWLGLLFSFSLLFTYFNF